MTEEEIKSTTTTTKEEEEEETTTTSPKKKQKTMAVEQAPDSIDSFIVCYSNTHYDMSFVVATKTLANTEQISSREVR